MAEPNGSKLVSGIFRASSLLLQLRFVTDIAS